jgi:hypothetical protein
MDKWGIEGTREHPAEVEEWLRKEAKKVGWFKKLTVAAKAVASGVAWNINPADPASGLVNLALERAEAKRLTR